MYLYNPCRPLCTALPPCLVTVTGLVVGTIYGSIALVIEAFDHASNQWLPVGAASVLPNGRYSAVCSVSRSLISYPDRPETYRLRVRTNTSLCHLPAVVYGDVSCGGTITLPDMTLMRLPNQANLRLTYLTWESGVAAYKMVTTLLRGSGPDNIGLFCPNPSVFNAAGQCVNTTYNPYVTCFPDNSTTPGAFSLIYYELYQGPRVRRFGFGFPFATEISYSPFRVRWVTTAHDVYLGSTCNQTPGSQECNQILFSLHCPIPGDPLGRETVVSRTTPFSPEEIGPGCYVVTTTNYAWQPVRLASGACIGPPYPVIPKEAVLYV